MLKKELCAIVLSASMLVTSTAATAGAVSLPSMPTEAYVVEVPDNPYAPPIPSVTKFWTSEWDAGWYRMESNLQLGVSLYSFDYDPAGSEVTTQNPSDYYLTEIPERFIGCDYIINRMDIRRDVYFFAEQDIEVYAAVDNTYTATPGALSTGNGWSSTEGQLATQDGRTYRLVKKDFSQGETVLLKAVGSEKDAGRNVFYMVLPKEGKSVSAAAADSSVVAEVARPVKAMGEKPTENAADQRYQYYLNDVFAEAKATASLPDGYTGSGATLNDTTIYLEAGANLAANASYTVGKTSTAGSPVDGSIDTYWQSADFTEENRSLTIDLGGTRLVDEITIKLRDYWGDRTQNLEILGSVNGTTYTTIVPAQNYLFEKAVANVKIISFAQREIRYLRITGTSNTEAAGVQVAELEVYGPAQTYSGQDHYVVLEKPEKGGTAAELVKTLDTSADGKLIFEARVLSSEKNQRMYIPLLQDGEGKTAAALYFAEDGYIKAAGPDKDEVIAAYTSDTWYSIKLVLDTENGKYDVWVDHLRKQENLPFLEAAAYIRTIRFTVESGARGRLQVDNLRLYDDTEIYVVEENFNDLETGNRPRENWQFTYKSKSRICEVPFASDKSLQLFMQSSMSDPVCAARSFTPLSGDVTVEAKIKAEESGWVTVPDITDGEGNTAVKIAAYRNSFFISDGNRWVYICDQEVPNNYYPADNWYYIKVVLNTYANTYDFYIDGAKRYSGACFVNDVDEISRVSFGVEQANVLYIDELKVYDSASLARGLMPEDGVYNVRSYGAKGDGVTDDTAAIAAAIEDAAGTGGTVLLENGVFYTGQITLQSDMTLFIDASAKILAKMDRNVYDKHVPSRGYNGNHQLGRGILYCEGVNNVRVTGGGTIDGNGFYALNQNDPSNQRPCILYLALSSDIYIDNLNLVQSPFWTLVPYESRNFTIRNVNITNHVAPNRDGIDPVNSSNITVENCHIIAGDDAFCPKSGNDIPSCNIEVRNCSMQSYCNGIKFGTDSYDDFRNYTFEDICMKCVGLSGITLQSSDGSDIDNIVFRRIDMNDVDNVFFACIGNRYRKASGMDDSYNRLGSITNILVEDLNYTDPMQRPYSHKNEDVHEALLIGLDPQKNTINDGLEHRISNVLFKNVYMEMISHASTIPALSGGIGGGYPEHTGVGASIGWAYTIRWADNVQFENCTNVRLYPDLTEVREEIVRADYTDDVITVSYDAQYVPGLADVQTAVGTPVSELPLPDTVPVLLENNETVQVPVTRWTAVGAYTPEKAGVYSFKATLASEDTILGLEKLEAVIEVTLQDTLLGDMNRDGQRTVSDVVEMRKTVVSGAYDPIGDMDGDGQLSVSDVVLLRNAIVKQ